MFASLLTGPIKPIDHFIGLTIEYQIGLLLFCVSAVLAGVWDWKVRGAPFKTFVFSGIGGILIDSYLFATVGSWKAQEILIIILIIQIVTIWGIALTIYKIGLCGNDDCLFLFVIALIPIGAGPIILIAAVFLFIHHLYRRFKHITANPYSDRYPRFYPLPMCSYLGIAICIYAFYTLMII